MQKMCLAITWFIIAFSPIAGHADANACFERGDTPCLLQAAEDLLQDLPEDDQRIVNTTLIAASYAQTSRFQEAERLIDATGDDLASNTSAFTRATALADLATVYHLNGADENALESSRAAVNAMEDVIDVEQRATGLLSIGDAQLTLGDLNGAKATAERLETLANTAGPLEFRRMLRSTAAWLTAKAGDHEKAAELIASDAAEGPQWLGIPTLVTLSYSGLTRDVIGDTHSSRHLMNSAFRMLRVYQDTEQRLLASVILLDAFLEQDDGIQHQFLDQFAISLAPLVDAASDVELRIWALAIAARAFDTIERAKAI